MAKIASFMYRLSLALWVGGVAVYTFLVTPAVFSGFGRDTAAKIVDSMMGAYFGYNLTIALVATALLFSVRSGMTTRAFKLSLAMGVIAVIICANINFVLYPKIAEVKALVTSFETMPKDTGPRAEFGRLHGISMALNLVYLLAGASMLYLSGCRPDREA